MPRSFGPATSLMSLTKSLNDKLLAPDSALKSTIQRSTRKRPLGPLPGRMNKRPVMAIAAR